jgi:hypothetical protein
MREGIASSSSKEDGGRSINNHEIRRLGRADYWPNLGSREPENSRPNCRI